MVRNALRSLLGLCLAALALGLAPLSAVQGLVINEIMYHPEDVDDRPFEWIELYNEHLDPLDLTDYTISSGVQLRFPRGTWLDGRCYLILCSDQAAFLSKHAPPAGVEVIEWQSGQLDNGGERIEICNPGGAAVLSVRYNDRGRWSAAADGTGHTLALVDPFSDISDADSWRHSLEIG
ncbi:MAG: lamin tail domain-containing protein, partial [Planctomycetes bacterium]|nr:lamin tail domain-containing protein [Planctomycetota bacterium]